MLASPGNKHVAALVMAEKQILTSPNTFLNFATAATSGRDYTTSPSYRLQAHPRMYLRTECDIPKDMAFPAKLAELGFNVNHLGQFVKLDSEERTGQLQTGHEKTGKEQQQQTKFYRFHYTDRERDNERRREAFQECVRQEVQAKLDILGLKEAYLSGTDGSKITTEKPTGPHVRILVSDMIGLKTQKDVVVISGEATQNLGIWAWRVLKGEGGINQGSAAGLMTKMGHGEVNFGGEVITEKDVVSPRVLNELEHLKRGQAKTRRERSVTVSSDRKEQVGVIILNPSELLYSHFENCSMSFAMWTARKTENALTDGYTVNDTFNTIPGHRDAAEHTATFFQRVLPGLASPHAKLHIVGLGDGAATLLSYLNTTLMADPRAKIANTIGHLALIQSTHTHGTVQAPRLLGILQSKSHAWVMSSRPKGTLLSLPADHYDGDSESSIGSLPGPTIQTAEISPKRRTSAPIAIDRSRFGFKERLKISKANQSNRTNAITSPTKPESSGKYTPTPLSPGNIRSARTSEQMMFPMEIDGVLPRPGSVAPKIPTVGETHRGDGTPFAVGPLQPTAKEAGHPDYKIPNIKVDVPKAGKDSFKPGGWHEKSGNIDAWLRQTADGTPTSESHLATQIPEPRLGTPDSADSAEPQPEEAAKAVESLVTRLNERFDSDPEVSDVLDFGDGQARGEEPTQDSNNLANDLPPRASTTSRLPNLDGACDSPDVDSGAAAPTSSCIFSLDGAGESRIVDSSAGDPTGPTSKPVGDKTPDKQLDPATSGYTTDRTSETLVGSGTTISPPEHTTDNLSLIHI